MEALSGCDGCDSLREHVELYVRSWITGEERQVLYCPECYKLAEADGETVAITHIPRGS